VSGVVFGVADTDVDVGVFVFQVAGMGVVAIMFVGASVGNVTGLQTHTG